MRESETIHAHGGSPFNPITYVKMKQSLIVLGLTGTQYIEVEEVSPPSLTRDDESPEGF